MLANLGLVDATNTWERVLENGRYTCRLLAERSRTDKDTMDQLGYIMLCFCTATVGDKFEWDLLGKDCSVLSTVYDEFSYPYTARAPRCIQCTE